MSKEHLESIEQGGLFGESLNIEINRYERYINSPQWQARRQQALIRAKYCCQLCGISKWSRTLEVHHVTYENLGNESPDELVVLCSECHNKEHQHWATHKTLLQKREYVEANWQELNEQARVLWGTGWWWNETRIGVIEKLSSLIQEGVKP